MTKAPDRLNRRFVDFGFGKNKALVTPAADLKLAARRRGRSKADRPKDTFCAGFLGKGKQKKSRNKRAACRPVGTEVKFGHGGGLEDAFQ